MRAICFRVHLDGVTRLEFGTTRLSHHPNARKASGEFFADAVAGKAADDDILAEFRDFRLHKILDSDFGVLDEGLLKEADRAVELVDFAIFINIAEHWVPTDNGYSLGGKFIPYFQTWQKGSS